ncbi:MAG: flagellar export chaperone FliS [Nitrospiraceae bacterium]|nr:MAG: flagellar export chaperone FliS [Nitrospiraceae bacterium]
MKGATMIEKQESIVSDRIQIVTMLYDGAINFIGKAREKMDAGDSIGKSRFIKKTTAIVQELSGSINMEGGEIANNLKNLYGFVLESLSKADISNNRDALNDAEKVVEILREAWQEIQQAENV